MNDNRKNFRRKNGRTKGGSRKPKEVEVNIDDRSFNKADLPHENDYSWYTKYKLLFENVTGVNFGNQVGAQLRWNPSLVSADPNLGNPTVSGVCAIHYIPTLGACDATLETPAAKVSAQLYSAMRMKLGSTATYDATDIMLYLGAVDSAYTMYALGAKIYGMLMYASPINNYFLEQMAAANGIDYESFSDNLSNFRSKLNQFAIFLSSRLVPASFDILIRHAWLSTNMFTDSDDAKAQIYTFLVDGYYTYTEVTNGPGYLKFNAMPYADGSGTLLTYTQYKAILNNIYESLMGSSDIDQMSADIGKAFEGNLHSLSLIPDDYRTPIVYSKEVLSQIENIVLCGVYNNRAVTTGDNPYHSYDIYQQVQLPKSPRLTQVANHSLFISSINAAKVEAMNSVAVARKMLNFHWMKPSQEDVIVASRGVPGYLVIYPNTTTPNLSYMQVQWYGSEVYTFATLYEIQSNGTLNGQNYVYATMTASNILGLLSRWSQFDWAPAFWIANPNDTKPVFQYMCDIDNYALVDWIQFKDMNTNAVLSEFYSDKFPQVVS